MARVRGLPAREWNNMGARPERRRVFVIVNMITAQYQDHLPWLCPARPSRHGMADVPAQVALDNLREIGHVAAYRVPPPFLGFFRQLVCERMKDDHEVILIAAH